MPPGGRISASIEKNAHDTTSFAEDHRSGVLLHGSPLWIPVRMTVADLEGMGGRGPRGPLVGGGGSVAYPSARTACGLPRQYDQQPKRASCLKNKHEQRSARPSPHVWNRMVLKKLSRGCFVSHYESFPGSSNAGGGKRGGPLEDPYRAIETTLHLGKHTGRQTGIVANPLPISGHH